MIINQRAKFNELLKYHTLQELSFVDRHFQPDKELSGY